MPAKILIGISMNPQTSRELLSWVIRTLARPNDTVVALHVLVGGQKNKHEPIANSRTQYRRAKAFVISVMGEFTGICQSKQVNLEARVGFSFHVGKGLIEEAKSMSPEFIIVGRSRNRSNRASFKILSYCFGKAPEGCSVVSVGTSFSSPSQAEKGKISSRRLDKNKHISKPISPGINEASPRTVLDICEGESNSTEEDRSSFGDSSVTESPPLALAIKSESNLQKPPSPFKRISSFFRSSFDLSGKKRGEAMPSKGKQQPLLRCFSYEELANATKHFHPDNVVGRGGYSEVYRGDLQDGRTIAVKRLAKNNTDEKKEKEFLTELGIIGHVNHPNTAALVGCCIENGLHLVFDFSPNGTLASALHVAGEVQIAIGIARGLHYLHKCCKHRIIHRDIKASNVLLGPNYEPQISDFGLAKWLPNKWTHHAVVPIEGTFGYLAPEYFMHGIVDEKTDVFAFGVLLLEIITGRRPVDSSKQNLLLWAKPLMESGHISELVDPKLEGKYNLDQMNRLVLSASYCVRQSSIWRPSMSEVLELLRYGDNSEVARSWRMPKFTTEEMDDYSMVFGYDLPSDISLDDIY
ncbi:Non-specific serine/threonine protein kinase [Bertholletia excelsa]